MKCASLNPKYLLICIVLLSWTTDASPLFDLGQLMNSFIGPFLANQKEQLMANSRKAANAQSKTTIEAVIEKKIVELKSVLQDYDKIEHKLDLDHDDTTIIEFYPITSEDGLRTEKNNSQSSKKHDTEPFTVDVEKYKKIKRKIDNILAKDTLTRSGKKIITNAFEDIVGKLLKNQCTWKSVLENTKTRRSDEKSEQATMRQWKKQFESLKDKYFDVLKRTEAPVSIEDLIQIFESFNEFFSQVMSDINGMSKRYEIKCKLIDKKRKIQYSPLETKDLLGRGNKHFRVETLDYSEGTCKNFKVCSVELSEFLKGFYRKVNETISSAFKNYAAMYDRDVNTDNSEEGTMVTDIINGTGDALEMKLEKIYKKKVLALTLDPKKDKQKNIKIINDFIKKVIESLNETVHAALSKDLGRLSHKIQQSVKRDVSVNVGIELGNLQKNTAEKVCSMFEQCSAISARRSGSGGGRVNEDQDDSLVFVQLKVNFTDDALARAAKGFLRSHQVTTTTDQPVDDHFLRDRTDDHSVYVRIVNDQSNGGEMSVDHSKKRHHRQRTHEKGIFTKTKILKSGGKHNKEMVVTRTTTMKSSAEIRKIKWHGTD